MKNIYLYAFDINIYVFRNMGFYIDINIKIEICLQI